MRTTLDLDVDVLQAAKELAKARGVTAGQMVSELVRKALAYGKVGRLRNGVPVIGPVDAGSPPTMQAVNRLRDE